MGATESDTSWEVGLTKAIDWHNFGTQNPGVSGFPCGCIRYIISFGQEYFFGSGLDFMFDIF